MQRLKPQRVTRRTTRERPFQDPFLVASMQICGIGYNIWFFILPQPLSKPSFLFGVCLCVCVHVSTCICACVWEKHGNELWANGLFIAAKWPYKLCNSPSLSDWVVANWNINTRSRHHKQALILTLLYVSVCVHMFMWWYYMMDVMPL